MRTLPRRSAWIPALVATTLACGRAPEAAEPKPTPELGSIAVTWALQTGDGIPTTCRDRALADAWISVGRESVIVSCGEEARVMFSNLTFGTYPVVIRLRDPSRAVRAEKVDTTVLETRGVQSYTHTFVFTDPVQGAGRLFVRWSVDGEPAAGACAQAGGVDVRISTREGSIAPLSTTAPCPDGEYLFENVRPGNYQLILELVDRTGRAFSVRPTSDLFVTAGEETRATVGFSTGPTLFGNLRTEWTIAGSPPADRCPLDSIVEVQLRIRNPSGGEVDIRADSSPCPRGHLEMRGLDPSPVYLIRFRLFDRIPLVVSSTVANNVALAPASTTTISFDLGLRN